MQVFWVSGPVGHIRSFNISFKTVIAGVALLVTALLLLGSLLQFLGFRLALEYDPQIAKRLGNLHTAVEVENMNAVYHARLTELENEHRKLVDQIGELHAARTRLTELLPSPVARSMNARGGQGGPYKPIRQDKVSSTPGGSVLARLDQSLKATRADQGWLNQEIKGWNASIGWLESLPISLPVLPSQLSVTSGFGERSDPFTQRRTMHAGLDFNLQTGDPVLAAGSGEVISAEWDGAYGQAVVIQHADAHTSRYAHNSELLVKKGDKVRRGQTIAKAGSTGRSTGTHLHFEIWRDGKAVDPVPYLVALQAQR